MNETVSARRIYSRITQKTYLHVEDYLGNTRTDTQGQVVAAPKLRVFAGNHGGGSGFVAHYVDLNVARVVFDDLYNIHQNPRFLWEDKKGGQVAGRGVLSNILKINTGEYKQKQRVFVELTLAPGKEEQSGIVVPIGRPAIAHVNIMLSVMEARIMAKAILDHIRAFDVCRLMFHATPENFPPYATSVRYEDDSQDGDRYTYKDGTVAPTDPRTRFAIDKFWDTERRAPRDGSEIEVWWQNNGHKFKDEMPNNEQQPSPSPV